MSAPGPCGKVRAMVRRDALARLAVGEGPPVGAEGAEGRKSRCGGSHVAMVGAEAGQAGRLPDPAQRPADRPHDASDLHRPARSSRAHYRYAVRGVDAHGRRGLLSHTVRVSVPLKRIPGPPGSAGPTPAIAPVQPGPGPAPITDPLTAAHGRPPVLARRLRPDGRRSATTGPAAATASWSTGS